MVISFSVKEARDQLLNEGIVYTYRWRRRAFFRDEKGTQEYTWANAGRLGPRICNVVIEEIGQMEPDEDKLKPYADKSGFFNLASWQVEINHLGWQWARAAGWLYKVEKL
jgi:hypothetical protein